MKSTKVSLLLDQIEIAISNVNSFSGISDQEKSYLAKFLIVYISGIFEECVETLINEMTAKISQKEICDFVQYTVGKSFRNPSSSNIVELLGRFSKTWKQGILDLPNSQRDALDSIHNNKNSLAHGSLSVLTLSDVVGYYHEAKQIIIKIDGMLL